MKPYPKLSQLRKQHHLSSKEMAEKLGISQSYYWQIENGTRKLYYDMAKKIAKVFALKPDDIFYSQK